MKSAQLLVLFLLSTYLYVAICDDQRYWHLVNEDAFKKDIKYAGTTDIDVLMNLCDQDPQCTGFNSNGWLKNDVSAPQYTANCDLYVKLPKPFPPSKPNLLPWPKDISYGSSIVGVSKNFQFLADNTNDDLKEAFDRFTNLIFVHISSSVVEKSYESVCSSLKVQVGDLNQPLQLNVDESYVLNFPSDGNQATLSAKTYYGALRGLETFSQIVTFNFTTRSYQVRSAPIAIQDAPRFSHRGILIDTSRHFEPIRTIRKAIDSLSYAKFNVLHWHISDSQSFPLYSESYPKLWEGAYSYVEKFTAEDVAALVEYARKRGVRVMPEYDVPGHASAWCDGYPEICPATNCTSPLNPATNKTFEVMAGLFGDSTGRKPRQGIFPDDFLHLGGDEVDTTCWSSTPSVAKWMAENHLTPTETYMYFVKRAHDIAFQYGRIPVNWEEVFNHFGTKLDPRTIIHIWLDHATLAKVVAAGYRGILSNQDVWYLDHLDTTWEQFYLNEPLLNIEDKKQQELVIGGEACMWGETVDTSDIFQTIWPRAAAVAERLWSPRSHNDPTAFLPRLEWFRCLLNRRDIAASPTLNSQARTSPPGPGGCLYQ